MDRRALDLFPRTVDEYVPQEHPVRFVVDLVESADLRGFESAYSGTGSAAYPPGMMLVLLLYGYITGIFSSRKLEEASRDSLAFRFVCNNHNPDHSTISAFRKRFRKEIKDFFVQVLRMAMEMGLTKLGTVSLDGTKVRANASKHKALSWRRAKDLEKQCRAEAEQLLSLAEDADQREVAASIDIPAELKRRKERLAGIKRAKEALETQTVERYEQEQKQHEARMQQRELREKATGKKIPGRKPQPPKLEPPRETDQVNLTDGDSRIMPHRGGFEQCYNGQIAVCHDSHLIAVQRVSQKPNDVQEVEVMLQEWKANTTASDRTLVADAGYFSRGNVVACEAERVSPLISPSKKKHNAPLWERLAPTTAEDKDVDRQQCPVNRMKTRLKTEDGRRLYAARKATAEPVFGIIKQTMGFRQFLTRGLEAVQSEWALVCTAYNIKRLHALKSG